MRPLNEDNVGKLMFLIPQSKVEDFSSRVLNDQLPCAVLYPTDDFHLSEEQFSAVERILQPEERLFVLQADLQSELYSSGNSFFEIERPFSYVKYSAIWLDSVSVLFSDSFRWAVITNEAPDGGEGLFIGYPSIIENFLHEYAHGDKDIKEFVAYYARRGLISPFAQAHIAEMRRLDDRRHSISQFLK